MVYSHIGLLDRAVEEARLAVSSNPRQLPDRFVGPGTRTLVVASLGDAEQAEADISGTVAHCRS